MEESTAQARGGGGVEAGRDVGESEPTWTGATDILHWCVFVWRSCECATSTELFFGVVTSGGGPARRASALGRAALKNHWRLAQHRLNRQRERGFELQG